MALIKTADGNPLPGGVLEVHAYELAVEMLGVFPTVKSLNYELCKSPVSASRLVYCSNVDEIFLRTGAS
mgnify:CR=1 FL=1